MRARISDTKLNRVARNLLSASHQEILNAVNLRFALLLTQLEEQYNQNQTLLQQNSEEIAHWLSLIAVLKEEASILCSGSLNRLFSSKGELLSRISALDLSKLPPNIDSLDVVVDVGCEDITKLINTFGRIGVNPPTILSTSPILVSWSAVDNALEYQAQLLDQSELLYPFLVSTNHILIY